MSDINNSTILIVDDTPANLDILVSALGDKYQIIAATDGMAAIELAEEVIPDLILLDIMMPEMDGFEVCGHLKKNPLTSEIPIIFLTALDQLENKTKAFEIGAVDYITKPFQIAEVKARVKTQITLRLAQQALKNQNILLEEKVQERTKDLLESQRDLELTQKITINCMANLAESKDPETGEHIKRTRNYIKALALYLKDHPKYKDQLDDQIIENLYLTAPLHDIGKVGIPDSILLKPGKLTVEEFEEMKKHTLYGRNALRVARETLGRNSFLRFAEEITYSHHEKWDGSGYPEGLKGEQIPLSGRLMALADVYDALISKRVYKPAFPHEQAYQIIVEGKGRHFDPDIVEAFIELHEEFRHIASQFADSQEE
ncbi:MAG: two-component system response regulator [SAR324 cluster bacterium]|uniref:Two-component system response regulator n=1 Tax=SAR324 cluster bacterium TaxID=2024889 RepID=A0A2A4T571_9DELT|nr:MAG: two-component system response regulator [SAR324 cluster bacterium]